MVSAMNVRGLWLGGLALLLGVAAWAQSGQSIPVEQSPAAPQQSGAALPLKPDLPGVQRNHRLILKDGSYQLVKEYRIEGDRVHYLSEERGEWEDLPSDLVDWDATREWEKAHAEPSADESPSPAMKEAEEVDREERQARDEQKARMPEVAPGLELPDEDGVFVLDNFHGAPELVELPATDMSVDAKSRHGLGVLAPQAGQTANLELEGAHARIHLHVNDPAIYLSLTAADDNAEMISHAITVKTAGTKAVNVKRGAHSEQSGFAIVRVDERNAIRVVGAVHVSPGGKVTQDEDVIAATSETLPGKHWLRIKPDQPLKIGEYALVEILPGADISSTVWDFRVDPTRGDNAGSITPILKPVDSR